MKVSAGYFCPVCEIRFLESCCKEGFPCGCGASKEEVPYIRVNYMDKQGREIYLKYKSFELQAHVFEDYEEIQLSPDKSKVYSPSWKEVFVYVCDQTMEIVQQNLILKALVNAFNEGSSGPDGWFKRCGKCVNWCLDDNLAPGTSLWKVVKCVLHSRCDLDCPDFKLNPEKAMLLPSLEEIYDG